MKPIAACFIFIAFLFCHAFTSAQPARSTRLFDDNWRFYKGDTVNAEKEDFNDERWRHLDLPHDWSIEDLPNQSDSVVGPFYKNSIGTTATGYVVGGTAWYRKHFTLSNSNNKKVSVYFDGVYMNADVYINGHHLGNHPYGYTAFYYDLTPYIKPQGQQNVLAVRVKNEGKNSRWYSGSGIYRHVWLTVANPLHVDQWGVSVTTPNMTSTRATILVRTTLVNDGNSRAIKLRTRIVDAAGKTVTSGEKNIPSNAMEASQIILLSKARLWSPDNPNLYKAVTEVWQGGKLVDEVTNNFGVRTIEFSATKGFLLNGKKMLLKGGCIHHDNGPLGSATIDRAEERKVELLKAYGYNAVRTSHNPPSQQFLDACDRLGLVVIDEAFDQWQRPKNPEDYNLYFNDWWQKDIASMISRDRNHPSIILWSIGNEINERADSSGIRLRKMLVDEVHKLDNTRPITEAICDFWDHKGYKWDTTAPAFAQLQVGGYNYMWKMYEPDHAKYPERVMAGTESFPKEAFENWQQVEQHPWVIGDFVWTAMDYLGETGIGHTEPDSLSTFAMKWPWFNAYCGDIDLIGGKKPQSWYRDIVWRRKKMAMLVHAPVPEGHKEAVSYWGWPDEYPTWNFAGNEGKSLQVNVYTRYPAVRLELNGVTIARKEVSDATKLTATFMVPYKVGVLKAIALNGGKEVDSLELRTTAGPAKIRMVADRKRIRASRNDLSYVTVEIVDANGKVVPDAVVPVQFSVTGVGEIAATGSANPSDMASFKKAERRTFRGKCLVIVRPKGKAGTITLKARSENLEEGQVTITAK